jgi:hypothetical protein
MVVAVAMVVFVTVFVPFRVAAAAATAAAAAVAVAVTVAAVYFSRHQKVATLRKRSGTVSTRAQQPASRTHVFGQMADLPTFATSSSAKRVYVVAQNENIMASELHSESMKIREF